MIHLHVSLFVCTTDVLHFVHMHVVRSPSTFVRLIMIATLESVNLWTVCVLIHYVTPEAQVVFGHLTPFKMKNDN